MRRCHSGIHRACLEITFFRPFFLPSPASPASNASPASKKKKLLQEATRHYYEALSLLDTRSYRTRASVYESLGNIAFLQVRVSYCCMRPNAESSAYVSIRQHTSAFVSIRTLRSCRCAFCCLALRVQTCRYSRAYEDKGTRTDPCCRAGQLHRLQQSSCNRACNSCNKY